MFEDFYFETKGQLKITAASIGISKNKWFSIKESEKNLQTARRKMEELRIDVLPIIEENGTIQEYYQTETPDNYGTIQTKIIGYKDTLDLNTDLTVVIEKFNAESRRHYFLTMDKEVVGLLTIGNLNCKEVQLFIFNVLCELESRLSFFISSNLEQKAILNWLEEKALKKEKHKVILKEYIDLQSRSLENKIVEHLYFIDLLELIREKKLAIKLGYNEKEWKSFNGINELRNKVAHPTRNLIDRENGIEKLTGRLHKINELLFCLKNKKE